jgi:hypothetical protein
MSLLERVHKIIAANEKEVLSSRDLRLLLKLEPGFGRYGIAGSCDAEACKANWAAEAAAGGVAGSVVDRADRSGAGAVEAGGGAADSDEYAELDKGEISYAK